MLKSMLLGKGAGLTENERKNFVDYFLSFQDKASGYFIDPTLENGEYISKTDNNYRWWGYGHCLLQVLPCLSILNVKPNYRFHFLEQFYHDKNFFNFLKALDFSNRVHFTSNEVMNIGVALQYEYCNYKEKNSFNSIKLLKQFLLTKMNSSKLWGNEDQNDTYIRSINIQAAYHFWHLFFFSNDNIPKSNILYDKLLSSQNRLGGFGVNENYSSACEDIDTIEPLSRFYCHMNDTYKKATRSALAFALPWVLTNQNPDGGFVFSRNRALHYGHDYLFSRENESSMFSTWFRVLSLAHLMRTLGMKENFYFCGCPGFLY